MAFWPKSLIREIADRRALIFVGSGISKAAKPDMPTWPELILNLRNDLKTAKDREFVKSFVKHGRLLDAAQIVSEGIIPADRIAKLISVFQIRPIPFHEIYQSILEMDAKVVVTTNYDEFLEKNFEHFSGGAQAYSVSKHTSTDLLDKLRSPGSIVLKIHGCITEPAKIVLDRSSYFDARRQNPGVFYLLSSLFTVNTVLFIGYSFGDPDMQLILENIHSAANSVNGHYSLIEKQEHRSLATSLRKSYNINCLEYGKGQHNLVSRLLSDLVEEVKSVRSTYAAKP